MKPQFKPEEIYLDLSKLSEEQQRKAISLLPEPINKDDYDITDMRFYLIYDEDCMWWISTKYFVAEKTELTYSQFLDMMGESEEVLQVENNGWISVDKDLPKHLETVFISNGKGWTSIGCLVGFDDGYHWAESNGVIYEENGKIVAECESDDLDVKKWHPFPLPPKH